MRGGDWRWQERNRLATPEAFERHLQLTEPERAGLAWAAAHAIRFGATPYYVGLADRDDPFCPIRMQLIPSPDESVSHGGERSDPLGEEAQARTSCLVHRYPDRALLLVTDRCSVYCRHCTRARLTQRAGSDLEPAFEGPGLEAALDYLAATPAIREVILSGGEPLLLSDERLGTLLERLSAIDHVKTLRVGSRMPVGNPMRITPGLAKVLRSAKPLFFLTHFNHPKECTAEAEAACATLVDHGIPVENQAVLMRRINSSARTLTALSYRLLEMRVRPYYLHQMDLGEGLEHLRTPIGKGIEILEAMRGHVSGLAIPHFAVDLPGGGGKVTLQPDYRLAFDGTQTTFRNYRGAPYDYPEPRETDCDCPYEATWFPG